MPCTATWKVTGSVPGRAAPAGMTCRRHRCAPEHHDGLAAKSVRHVHGALHKALQNALERGHVGRNVAALADPPSAKDAKSRRSRVADAIYGA